MLRFLASCFVFFQVCIAMPRVQLSPEGPEVSAIAFGILHLGQDTKVKSVADAVAVMEAARLSGITTFDLAPNYAGTPPPLGPGGKSLELFGQALQSLENKNPGYRNSIEVICKMGELDKGGYYPGGPLPYIDTSPEYTELAVNFYLKILNTTYLDVLVWHQYDRLIEVDEMAATFKALKDKGIVRHFGVSNYKPFQFELLARATAKVGIILVTNEVVLSPWVPKLIDDGTLEDAMMRKIRPLFWGPLGGDPSGGANFLFKVKYPTNSTEAKRQTNIRIMLQKVGDELGGISEDVVCLAWALRHPAGGVPIIGTMNVTRIALQSQAINVSLKLTRRQWWDIADVAGVLIFGSPIPFVAPFVPP